MDATGSEVNNKTFFFFDGLKDGRNKMDPALDNSFFDGINIYCESGNSISGNMLFDPIVLHPNSGQENASTYTNTLSYTNPIIKMQKSPYGFPNNYIGVNIGLFWGTDASGTTIYGGIYDGSSAINFRSTYRLSGFGYSSFSFSPSNAVPTPLSNGKWLYLGVTNTVLSYPWGVSGINYHLATGGTLNWGGAYYLDTIDAALGDPQGSLYFGASNWRVGITDWLIYPTSGSVLIANGNISYFNTENNQASNCLLVSGIIPDASYFSYPPGSYPLYQFVPKLFLEPVNMNDRSAVVYGGPSNPPGFIYCTNGSFFASSMLVYFKNGTSSDASGYQLATVWPSVMCEFKNHFLLDNVTIQYSDSSGAHTEFYPNSSFPSDGYIPYVFDWDEEILFDTTKSITNSIEYRDFLFRWTEDELYYTAYDSNGVQSSPQRVIGAPGTRYNKSAAVLNAMLFWANEEGVYVTDGSGYKCVSEPIKTLYRKKMALTSDSISKSIRVYGNEKTSELFVSITFYIWRHDSPPWSYSGPSLSPQSGFTFIYNANTNSWGGYEIPIIGIVNNGMGADTLISSLGGVFIRPFVNLVDYALDYTCMEKTIYYSYGATGHTKMEKACLLSPDYSKQADTVYARMLMKGCSAASQAFKISTFWDGHPSSPNAQSFVFNVTATQTGYDDVVTTNKFPVSGKGNLAYFKLERNPTEHGDQPLEFIGIQIQYSLVDRSDE